MVKTRILVLLSLLHLRRHRLFPLAIDEGNLVIDNVRASSVAVFKRNKTNEYGCCFWCRVLRASCNLCVFVCTGLDEYGLRCSGTDIVDAVMSVGCIYCRNF